MLEWIRTLGYCLGKGLYNTINHDGIEHAGYLAFLGLLPLFPFLVFLVALLGALGQDVLTIEFLTRVFQSLPPELVSALEPRIQEITTGPPQGLLTLAIVGAIWTASSAVEGLRTTLNRAYHVTTPPNYLFRRSLSILQLIVFTFVLLIGMVLLVSAPVVIDELERMFGAPLVSGQLLQKGRIVYIGTLLLMMTIVASIYYSLPNIKQHVMSVVPGAALVVVLWTLAARVLVYYLHHFNQFSLIYGSLGGTIAALLFFYICNVIFIFGAEFNHLLSVRLGIKIEEREETGLPLPEEES